ncbi:hypothetical protein O6H91_12G026100 [Diphasiastrum complanatum]|uniref:Uncharacterized protein n=6 Tax=Diphasiastrum complanatum TaxID=34168 RepID=A0ACC2BZU6_DIPCM|nr:hypothetical protein O6H91_12G026100 [Diphasiastrum complanatum]
MEEPRWPMHRRSIDHYHRFADEGAYGKYLAPAPAPAEARQMQYFPRKKQSFYPRYKYFRKEVPLARLRGREMEDYPRKKQIYRDFTPDRFRESEMDYFPERKPFFKDFADMSFKERMDYCVRRRSMQAAASFSYYRDRGIGRAAQDDDKQGWWQRKRPKMCAAECESRFGAKEGYFAQAEGDDDAEVEYFHKRYSLEREMQADEVVMPVAKRSKPVACRGWWKQQLEGLAFGRAAQEDCVSSVSEQLSPERYPASATQNPEADFGLYEQEKEVVQSTETDHITTQRFPLSSEMSRQKPEAYLSFHEQEKAVQSTEKDCITIQRLSLDSEISLLKQSDQANRRSPFNIQVFSSKQISQETYDRCPDDSCKSAASLTISSVAEPLAVGRAVQEDCISSVSEQRSQESYPAAARQKPEAYFSIREHEKGTVQTTENNCIATQRFPLNLEISRQKPEAYLRLLEQEKAVLQATEKDCMTTQCSPLSLEVSSSKQSDTETQRCPFRLETFSSRQSSQEIDGRCPNDSCKSAASSTTSSVTLRKERVKPIAVRSWKKRCVQETVQKVKFFENDSSCSPITQPAEARPPCESLGVMLTEQTFCTERQADIYKCMPKHLEFDKLPHRGKTFEHRDAGVFQVSPPLSNKQRNGEYTENRSRVDLDKSILQRESNCSEADMEHVDVVNSASYSNETRHEYDLLRKEYPGSSSASTGRPLSPVSPPLSNKNTSVESLEEISRSNSGSSMVQGAVDSSEISMSAPSLHVDVISSSPDSKITEDKNDSLERDPERPSLIATHKQVVKHFMFKRPVAIKSKNCFAVVKRKRDLLDSLLDENAAYPKRKWDQKRASSDLLSKSYSIKTYWNFKEWQVKERLLQCSAEVVSRGRSKDAKEDKARSLVLETLKQFDLLRRKVLRDGSDFGRRADLKAGMIMKRNNLRINEMKRVGPIPGIEVGDQFFFRIEMLVVGLHMQVQAGIDFIVAKESKFSEPVAVSIVASVGYDYDLNEGDTLIYTGQGGNVHKDDKIQEDQKLVRGNLALRNSHRQNLPVRVIRCYGKKNRKSDKIYTYDGLYQVEKIWNEKGRSGCLVYKFCLQRLCGQPQLVSAYALPSSSQD